MNKILYIGGMRDGQWFDDDRRPFMRVGIPASMYPLPIMASSAQVSMRFEENVYERRPFFNIMEGKKIEVMALKEMTDADIMDALLKGYGINKKITEDHGDPLYRLTHALLNTRAALHIMGSHANPIIEMVMRNDDFDRLAARIGLRYGETPSTIQLAGVTIIPERSRKAA